MLTAAVTPIIATVNFDANDHHLVDPESPRRSKWLLDNAVLLRLPEGNAFYERRAEVPAPEADTLFARHLRESCRLHVLRTQAPD